MPNYKNGKIYTIRSLSREDLIYVGSTTQSLSERFRGHKCGKSTSRKVIDLGDAYIELVEEYPCDNRMQLNRREGEIMRSMDCVNRCVAGRTEKEYRIDNKEKIAESEKEYRQNNKEKIAEYTKEYRQNNKEKVAEQLKQYRLENKVAIAEKKKQYQKENKEKIAIRRKKWGSKKVICDKCQKEMRRDYLNNHMKNIHG